MMRFRFVRLFSPYFTTMQRPLKSSTLALGVALLLCLALFMFPWSPSTQPGGFSLTLDLDDSEGDQAVSSLDLLPDQPISIQIFGTDIQNTSGISVCFRYDGTQVAYEGFDPGEALPNANASVEQDSISVRIDVSSVSGPTTMNGGWIGTVRFRITAMFSDTETWLVHAELARGGQTEAVSPALGVALQVVARPSPDFDGNGQVGFSDFVAFGDAYGSRPGDETYRAKYDLNGDGSIGFDLAADFVGASAGHAHPSGRHFFRVCRTSQRRDSLELRHRQRRDRQCGRPGGRRQNGDSDHDAPYRGDYLHAYGQ